MRVAYELAARWLKAQGTDVASGGDATRARQAHVEALVSSNASFRGEWFTLIKCVFARETAVCVVRISKGRASEMFNAQHVPLIHFLQSSLIPRYDALYGKDPVLKEALAVQEQRKQQQHQQHTRQQQRQQRSQPGAQLAARVSRAGGSSDTSAATVSAAAAAPPAAGTHEQRQLPTMDSGASKQPAAAATSKARSMAAAAAAGTPATGVHMPHYKAQLVGTTRSEANKAGLVAAGGSGADDGGSAVSPSALLPWALDDPAESVEAAVAKGLAALDLDASDVSFNARDVASAWLPFPLPVRAAGPSAVAGDLRGLFTGEQQEALAAAELHTLLQVLLHAPRQVRALAAQSWRMAETCMLACDAYDCCCQYGRPR